MNSIFISHSWEDDDKYQEFKALLDRVLGRDSWHNLSIPRSESIALRGPGYLEQEEPLDRLEDELVLVQAAFSKPGLPEVDFRFETDQDGNPRELETVGSLGRKLARLQEEISGAIARLPREYHRPPEFDNRKNAAGQIRLHPELVVRPANPAGKIGRPRSVASRRKRFGFGGGP